MQLLDSDLSQERAFLVGVELKRQYNPWRIEDSLEELGRLANTAGLEVVGQEIQRLDSPTPATYIGSGKVKELKLFKRDLDFNVLLFDDELSPRQQRNLEEEVDIKVVDRTALILDIFGQHAHTKEGQLQVELAQLEYRLPRLTRMWTHLARQAGGRAGGAQGGVGVRGPGETQLEVDRREVGRRIARLKDELESVRQHRQMYRKQRKRAGIPTVSLVGYTNAGKSTLLNSLTEADVPVADQLFATLDPTTRRFELPGGTACLFTDTVGFIHKLPTQLVAAFRATLEEITESDILLHIVDITHSNAFEQADEVEMVLEELGANERPMVVALNKVDKVLDEKNYGLEIDNEKIIAFEASEPVQLLLDRYPDAVLISATWGIGLKGLLEQIEGVLIQDMVEVDVLIPYRAGEMVNLFHTRGRVEEENYNEHGTLIHGKLPTRLVGYFEPYFDGLASE
ncbi:MAG: GTPase HflX [Anaerolineales bacterium]|nr:GTPase HflX [Anaerolineales bacterium]